MRAALQRLWRKDGAGLTGSLLLHLVLVAAIIWWSMVHPVRQAPPLKAMMIDLVTLPVVAPGKAGGAVTVAPKPRLAVAPKVVGVRPKATKPPPPEDAVEARIAALSKLQSAASTLPAPDNDGTSGGTGDGGGYALADYVRSQILRRWWPDLSSRSARGMPVAMRLKLSRSGVISDIRILDQARFNNDKEFRNMALSARDAAILASPILLPPGQYPAMMDIAITLDPKAVLH